MPNLVFGLFLVKALLLGFVLVPFGIGPDERHHFSYAYDLAIGDFAPIVGGATSISVPRSDLWPSEVSRNRNNYISQHPPLHYLVAAVPLRMALSAADSTELVLRSPRVVSAIFGGLGLLVVHRTLRTVSGRSDVALAVMVGLSFIPMYSYLSAVVNNDISLFFFSALAAESFVRFVAIRELTESRRMIVWVAMASLTKAFAWISGAMIVAVVLVLLLRGGHRPKALVTLAIAAAAAPLFWLVRNSAVRGDALAGSGLGGSRERFRVTPWEYITEYPVVDWLLLHSNALYGWARPGLGLRIMTVTGWPLAVFSFALLIVAVVMLRAVLMMLVEPSFTPGTGSHTPPGTPYRAAVLIAGSGVALVLYRALPQGLGGAEWMRAFFVSAIMFSATVVTVELLRRRHEPLDGPSVALIIFCAYTVVFLLQRASGYSGGNLRGVHGRYFWTVLPFLLIFVGAAARKISVSRFVLTASVALLAMMELGAYLTQLFPHEGVF